MSILNNRYSCGNDVDRFSHSILQFEQDDVSRGYGSPKMKKKITQKHHSTTTCNNKSENAQFSRIILQTSKQEILASELIHCSLIYTSEFTSPRQIFMFSQTPHNSDMP